MGPIARTELPITTTISDKKNEGVYTPDSAHPSEHPPRLSNDSYVLPSEARRTIPHTIPFEFEANYILILLRIGEVDGTTGDRGTRNMNLGREILSGPGDIECRVGPPSPTCTPGGFEEVEEDSRTSRNTTTGADVTRAIIMSADWLLCWPFLSLGGT